MGFEDDLECIFFTLSRYQVRRDMTQPVKVDLNRKFDPKQKKIIQTFNIDTQGFRKTKNENSPTWEIRFIS